MLNELIKELNSLIEDYTEEPDAFETKTERELELDFQKHQDSLMKNREFLLTKLYNYLKKMTWVHDIVLVNNKLSFIVDGNINSQLAFRKWEAKSKILKDFKMTQYNDEEYSIKVIIS